jgi:hypothetical protein
VSSVTGLWDPPDVALREQAIYTQPGATLIDDEPTRPVREIGISGTFIGDDPDDLEALLLAVKQLFGVRGRKDLTLVFGNDTTTQITARYVGLGGGPQMAQRKAPFTFKFRALTPYFEDTSDTTLGPTAANTPVAIPLGTELSVGTMSITFGGSASSVTFTYKNFAGDTIGTLTCTHAFVNADVLVVDNAGTITLNGVRNDALLDESAGGDFIRFDPDDGDAALSHWPTIEADVGPLTVVYRRRWD